LAGIAADSSAAVVEPLVAEGVSGVEEDESEQIRTGCADGGEIMEDRREWKVDPGGVALVGEVTEALGVLLCVGAGEVEGVGEPRLVNGEEDVVGVGGAWGDVEEFSE